MAMLQVSGLAKSFGEIEAVKGIDFQVEPGEIYGLLGPNGAGKTTTISMVSGLLRPDQGQVHVQGRSFWENPPAAQRAMGVVPQEIALYEELSGEGNLIFWGKLAGLSGREAKVRAAEVLDMLSLTDRRKEAVKDYSGGMKRRINIGCALMHKPALVLMDEPSVGIDPQARLKILDFVRHLADSGTAVLYTTHYLEEAESLCRRIGIIDQGELLAEGTLAELQARLGGQRLFALEGVFGEVQTESIAAFRDHFRVAHHSAERMLVADLQDRHPAECIRELLDLPVEVENVTLKKPSLNDVFLQLTGRDLRE